ncbi:hypothetical protein PoB_004747400 [Plakobranchus ocellatus]|uniref:C2H2-type domain-containing protein n=1 Tax=Plakobranchus ocellatus TaxID=259542 RepID=A0AAV4BRI9_9GAST|nr:hypothetical protein PoB_004747400 [Plakobranchus ocellatus]
MALSALFEEKITPAIAEEKLLDQGYHECDVCAEGYEGSKAWKECKKHPDHRYFTPASQFHPGLLPPPYDSDPEVAELVRQQIELTVRLRVRHTSKMRPDGYCFSNFRGRNVPHTGSGIVLATLYKFPRAVEDNEAPYLCPCQDCDDAVLPARRKLEWWSVQVQTAKHVVFDTEEAKTTTADLYLDLPGQKGSKHQLHGLSAASTHIDGDIARIAMATHDEAVGQSLSGACKHFGILTAKLLSKHRDPTRFPLYTVICSHPHGCSKQITIGQRIERIIVNEKVEGAQPDEEWTEYVYTTPTCQGSSGAPVVLLGRDKISGRQWCKLTHVHRQALPTGQGHSGMTLECLVNTDQPVNRNSLTLPL